MARSATRGRTRPGPRRARRTSIDYRPQAQVRADAERAIASSQAAHAKFAAAAARNTIAHPTASVVKEPPTSVTAPRPTKTPPEAMRTRANARRWRYSNGQIMRCMPDRGGDAHHPRRPFGAVLSFGSFIGMPLVSCGVGRPITYQYDITLIDDRKSDSAGRPGRRSDGQPSGARGPEADHKSCELASRAAKRHSRPTASGTVGLSMTRKCQLAFDSAPAGRCRLV